MPTIDLAFVLRGSTIPLDYGYALFGALCRVVPELHGNRRIGVHPIRGIRLQPRRLTLVPQSRLRIRLPIEQVGSYLALVGTRLDLEGSLLEIGLFQAEPLRPATNLISRLVTIGHHIEPESVLASLMTQMAELGVVGNLALVPSPDPARVGEQSRRVLRIKDRRIVGYAVTVGGLTAEGSLTLQEQGLGSRRRMGCGVLVPLNSSSWQPGREETLKGTSE
jgi:CRISPR-associated protein Cas6